MAPKQKPGKSRQDYATPRSFIEAVEARFGKMHVDLAATASNAKAPCFITPEEDSLSVEWSAKWHDGNCWLNPPFSNIEPWAAKCAEESRKMHRGKIFLLTPASIGTNWFAKYVLGHAVVLGISPRLTFEGEKDPYPKDLSLAVYASGLHGFDCWRWV